MYSVFFLFSLYAFSIHVVNSWQLMQNNNVLFDQCICDPCPPSGQTPSIPTSMHLNNAPSNAGQSISPSNDPHNSQTTGGMQASDVERNLKALLLNNTIGNNGPIIDRKHLPNINTPPPPTGLSNGKFCLCLPSTSVLSSLYV